jgi:ribonuclease T2
MDAGNNNPRSINMTRNGSQLLLIPLIFTLLLNACAALPEALKPVRPNTSAPATVTEETVTPALTDTPVPTKGKMGWPLVTPASADFDYYVLALSWAPNYCVSNPDDKQECSLGRRYAFVLHGLWPQYTKGYPSDCSSEPLPSAVKAKFSQLYPSDKLFDHEWGKHGTCSGLSPSAYLTLTGQLKNHLQIPAAYHAPASPFHTSADDLKQAFLKSNPALVDTGLAVNCSGSGRYLSELYACFSKDGQPAICGEDVLKSALKSCSSGDFIVRNVR